MENFKVRDVYLDSCGEREISRERVEAYMRHLGINLVWVKRDETIKADGSKQCAFCLETKQASEFETVGKDAKNKASRTCWTCRKRYGYNGTNVGTSKYMGMNLHSTRRSRVRKNK
jgi:hypothetical protein